MKNNPKKIGEACAEAFFQSYQHDISLLETFYTDSLTFHALVKSDAKIGQLFKNKLLTESDKSKILLEVMPFSYLKKFIKILENQNLLCYWESFLSSFRRRYKKQFHIKTINVISANLDAEVKECFTKFLKERFPSTKLETSFAEQKDLQGGFIIESEDFYWNNSLEAKLKHFNQFMEQSYGHI